jgi:protein involved in polysaccharide export with SLBB domain
MGLTEESIQERLTAEPALRAFDVEVSLLDVKSAAAGGLEPFGYEVFESSSGGFEPVTSGPVPPDYVLGPGDSVRVQLFGNVNGIYEFEVSRDGILNLPELGPITVAGLPFSEFRRDLNQRVEKMLIGTQVSVTMGQLRTMRIFVLGDVNRPGSFVVSSLATISSALYYSGGISEIGSLRNIQLKRNGKVVSRLDMYDLLLKGDTSRDERLRPGDVIFVPPIGATVGIGGAVKRPAIYELNGERSVAEGVDGRVQNRTNRRRQSAHCGVRRCGKQRGCYDAPCRRGYFDCPGGFAAAARFGDAYRPRESARSVRGTAWHAIDRFAAIGRISVTGCRYQLCFD